MQPTKSVAAIQIRLRGEDLAQFENWRRAQPQIPSRSESMRELIRRGLGADQRRQALSEPRNASDHNQTAA
jgi:hypothetical protein